MYKFFNKSFISVNELNKDALNKVLDLAGALKNADRSKYFHLLDGYILGNLFFEPSTRTRMSFASAFMKLGGSVNSTVGVTFSSMAKGESIADTIRVIDGYTDVIVMRHPDTGSVGEAAKYSNTPVINAGDGIGEHPTQALLDIFTIKEENNGIIDGITISIIGDLKYGRVIHSLVKLLSLYDKINFIFVAPELVQIPDNLADNLVAKGCSVKKMNTLDEALSQSDIVYTIRMQEERFSDPAEFNSVNGLLVLNKAKIEQFCKKDVVIMHPLPRLGEMSTDVDSLPNAAYFRQTENGMWVRMALFLLTLGKETSFIK